VTSVLGVGRSTRRRMSAFLDHLRDRRSRRQRRRDRRTPQGARGEAGGREALYRAGAGHSDHDRMSRSQYQYTITTGDNAELLKWSDKLFDAMRREPVLSNVARTRRRSAQPGAHRPQTWVGLAYRCRMSTTSSTTPRPAADFDDYTQSNQYRVILEASEQYQPIRRLEKLYVARPAAVADAAEPSCISTASPPAVGLPSGAVSAATISFDSRPARRSATRCSHRRGSKKYSMPPCRRFSATRGSLTSRSPASPISFSAASSRFTWCWRLYESFAHPFTVLTTLPSAGVGALSP